MATGMLFSSRPCYTLDIDPDPSQPFPSPGSAFVPPPIPGPHEFAVPTKMTHDDVADVPEHTTRNGTTTPTANGVALGTSPNGVFQDSSSPALDPPDSASDPQLAPPGAHHMHYRLSTQSVTSLTSSRPAPPSPAMSRRTSEISRASSRPASGMSITASSRPASGIQHSRSVSGLGSRPTSGTIQPITPITTTSGTPIPTTPRHTHEQQSNHTPTIPVSDVNSILAEPASPPTQATATAPPTTSPILIQIRDYAFVPSDPRFSGQGPYIPRANRPAVLARRLASSSKPTAASPSEGDNDDDDDYEDEEDDDEKGEEQKMDIDMVPKVWEDMANNETNGWGGFKWGFGRPWVFGRMSGIANSTSTTSSNSGFPSRGDLDRNFGGEDEYEDMEFDEESDAFSDEEGEGESYADTELLLVPGVYRALYAFEPEGTAEMRLDEDQLVRVIGRGGGVGWAVVVKDGLKDTGMHALVPESYLEPVRLDVQEDV